MEGIKGKHFSITDPQGVNTVIYRILETEKEYIELLKPQLEILGNTHDNRWLMHEMYKTINNVNLKELEETE